MLGGWLGALVLDFDGTIVDTESVVFGAWETAWASVGATLVLDEWLACVGTRGRFDPLGRLEEAMGGPVDRVAVARVADEEEARQRAHLGLRPGVRAWLDEAAAAQVPVAVATSSDHRWVAANLDLLGIGTSIRAICAYDDVGDRAKPDPATYAAACAALGVAPSAALAVEDSANGLAAARAAGLRTVVCPNPVTAAMDLSGADLRLSTLADSTLAAVATRLRPTGAR